jgi:hypothetical protein
MNEVLARLQKGESVDSIASDMTKILNAAKDAYEAEQAKAKENEAKKIALRKMAEGAREFCVACGQADLMSREDVESIANSKEIMDEITELIENVAPLLGLLDKLDELLPTDCPDDCECDTCKSDNDRAFGVAMKNLMDSMDKIYNIDSKEMKEIAPKAKKVAGTPMSDRDIVNDFLKSLGFLA